MIIIEGDKDELLLETMTRSDGVKVSCHGGIKFIPGMVIQGSTKV